MKSYSHLKDFNEDSRFYTWLVRIAANEALMRLRKRRPNQVSLDEPVETAEDLGATRDRGLGDRAPKKQFAQSEMQEILSGVIDTLEPELPHNVCAARH